MFRFLMFGKRLLSLVSLVAEVARIDWSSAAGLFTRLTVSHVTVQIRLVSVSFATEFADKALQQI